MLHLVDGPRLLKNCRHNFPAKVITIPWEFPYEHRLCGSQMRELPPRTACRCCFLLWTLTRLLLHLLRTCCSTLVLLVHSFRPARRLLLRGVRGRCRFWLWAQEDRCHLLVLLPIDLNVLVLLIGRILAWLQGISQCHIALEFHWRLVFYDARSNHKVPRWYRWVG